MKLALFSYVWPEPESSAAGVRTIALLQGIQKQNWDIQVFSPCSSNPARARLEGLGFKCQEVEANDSTLQENLKHLAPDIVIFDRFVLEEQFGFHVAKALPNAVRVVDTQDLHFLRHSREIALKQGAALAQIFSTNIPWDERALLRECASIYRSDLSLLLSSFEISLLTNHFQIPRNLLDLASISVHANTDALPAFSSRKHFCFIGNYRHPPNLDGALWFTKNIWPQIRKNLAGTEFHLWGAYAPKEISSLENPKAGIRFMGQAKDAQATLASYRVNLAPLRFGAGIKGKIADGWSAGTPCISTPIGTEGMGDESSWGGIVALNEESFAAGALALYTEEALWQKHQIQGQKILKQQFDFEANTQSLIARLLELKENLNQYRSQNLMGRILWREEARSTEFFSRWIELKEKLAEP